MSLFIYCTIHKKNSLPIIKKKGGWVLKCKGGCDVQSRYHCSNSHIKSEFLNAPSKYTDKDDMELAIHCDQSAISSTSIAHLLNDCIHFGYIIDYNPSQNFIFNTEKIKC